MSFSFYSGHTTTPRPLYSGQWFFFVSFSFLSSCLHSPWHNFVYAFGADKIMLASITIVWQSDTRTNDSIPSCAVPTHLFIFTLAILELRTDRYNPHRDTSSASGLAARNTTCGCGVGALLAQGGCSSLLTSYHVAADEYRHTTWKRSTIRRN